MNLLSQAMPLLIILILFITLASVLIENFKSHKGKNFLISYNRYKNGNSVLYIQSERFNLNKKIYFKKRKENKEKYINIKF